MTQWWYDIGGGINDVLLMLLIWLKMMWWQAVAWRETQLLTTTFNDIVIVLIVRADCDVCVTTYYYCLCISMTGINHYPADGITQPDIVPYCSRAIITW